VVFYTHGGGWISGANTDELPAARASYLASQGYLVVSANYTLSTPTSHLWDSTESQLACAMVWTENNAGRFGGNTERLAVGGDSAGGNLALELAYRSAAGTLTSSCGGTPPQVDAVSVLYPVASPQSFYDNSNPVFGGLSREMAGSYTGGAPESFPTRYEELTPAQNVTQGAPATLITVGTHDHLVPPHETYDLVDLLTSKGVPNQLIGVPFAEHVFDSPTAVGTQIWEQATVRWLRQHGV